MVKHQKKLVDPKEDNLAVGAKGGAIAFLLKIFATALGFINQIILARILGAGGIGEVILALTVVRISVHIAKFGMEETMMKFVSLYIDKKDNIHLKGTIFFSVKFCLLFSIVFVTFILLLSKFISINIFHAEGLLKLLPIVIVAIPALVIRDVIGSILRGYKDILRALIPESFVSPFLRLVIFLFLMLKGVGPVDAIVAFVAGEIVAVIMSIIFLQKRVRGLRHIERKCEKRKILDMSYTIIFTTMAILLFTDADRVVLGYFTSTETVGVYGIAAKLIILIYFPVLAFNAIIPPLISSIYSSGDIQELRRVVRESTRWILSMAMPIILILILEGKTILKYAYGPEFESGYVVLLILTAGQLVKAGTGLVGIILQMTGHHKIYMKINIIWGIINIVLNVLLVPRFGMIGAALATAICLSMIDISCIILIHKRLSIITLAKGLSFDIVFISIVIAIYLLINQMNYSLGQHLLLIIALTIYLWKSISHNDIPWKLLLVKYKER